MNGYVVILLLSIPNKDENKSTKTRSRNHVIRQQEPSRGNRYVNVLVIIYMTVHVLQFMVDIHKTELFLLPDIKSFHVTQEKWYIKKLIIENQQ